MTEAQTTTRLAYRPLDSLSRWQRNYNHGDVVAIRSSIHRFGFNGALRVWKDQVIMAGNHTWIALCHLRDEGHEPSGEGLRVEDDGAWSVLCLDVSHLTIQEAEAFAIADNRTAALATHDEDQLAELLNELGADPTLLEGIGYSEDEVDALLARLAGGNEDVDDPGPCEPLEQPTSQPGDMWLLGDHRLLCGDSTKSGDVERLMAGETARLLATDPPYCVDYTGDDRPDHDGRSTGKDWSGLFRETEIEDLGEFLRGTFAAVLPHVHGHSAVYCWHAHLKQPTIARVFEEFDILLHQVIVWVKPAATFGRSFFRWKHEPCAFGWRRGSRPESGAFELDTVWEVDWEGKARVVGNEHPTQKPTKLFEIPMELHTKPGDVVLEPFSGSGSQLIAAEKLGRRCRALEITPAFVDAAIRRWQLATGQEAILEAEKIPFATVMEDRRS